MSSNFLLLFSKSASERIFEQSCVPNVGGKMSFLVGFWTMYIPASISERVLLGWYTHAYISRFIICLEVASWCMKLWQFEMRGLFE